MYVALKMMNYADEGLSETESDDESDREAFVRFNIQHDDLIPKMAVLY